MLKDKICPYCNQSLELSIVSATSPLFGKDTKYVGCSNCGKPSLLYKDEKLVPLNLDLNKGSVTSFINRDMNNAFSLLQTNSTSEKLEEVLKKMEKEVVVFGNPKTLNNIKENTPILMSKEGEIKEDNFFKPMDRLTNKPNKIEKNNDNKLKNYLVIDDNGRLRVFYNTTKDNLILELEKDNHKGKNYDEYEIYELKNPLKVKKVITIE